MKPGDWVRIRPKNGNPHFVGAKIVAINKTKVTIQPICHGRLEVVDLAQCRPWKGRNLKETQ